MTRRRDVLLASVLAAALAAGCGAGRPEPARVDPANDQCASCRMVVSEPRFAAQVMAPGEEPRFYDDLQCLRDGLRAAPPPAGAVVFVADVRTGAWVEATRAVFAHVPARATPMGSHWVGYDGEASRQADPEGAGAEPVQAAAIFGAEGLVGRTAGPAAGGGEK